MRNTDALADGSLAVFTKYGAFLATLGTQEGMLHRSQLAIAASKRLYSAITAENKTTSARNDDPSRDSGAVYEVFDGLPPREAADGARGHPTFDVPFSEFFQCAEHERCGRGPPRSRLTLQAAAPIASHLNR